MSRADTPQARLIPLPANSDERGSLIAAECPETLPFTPHRMFLVDHVPAGQVRGDHAHRECHQFLVCTAGSVEVELIEPSEKTSVITLEGPDRGLHIPPLVWARQRYRDPNSQLLVLASHPYSPAEYITDFAEYVELRQ